MVEDQTPAAAAPPAEVPSPAMQMEQAHQQTPVPTDQQEGGATAVQPAATEPPPEPTQSAAPQMDVVAVSTHTKQKHICPNCAPGIIYRSV